MKRSQIALGVAAAFGVTIANAAIVNLNLDSAASETTSGASAKIVGGTATWTYDTVTDILTASGQYLGYTQIAPIPGQLFTHDISDLVVGGGGAASATSYACIEGSFGGAVGASLCGNYSFTDFINESTSSWGPGVAFSRTIGGNDVALGPQQNISGYDGMVGSWDGTTLVMSNVVALTSGESLTLSAVPVPAAAWLFGSALGLLGWARRRTTA